MKKQVWCEGKGCWQDRNLSANRIAVDCVRKNFRGEKFKLTELQKALGVDRKTAWNWITSLRKSGFVNSKSIGPRMMLDNRWYQLSKKGMTKLPRKKPFVKVVEKIKEVPVEVEKRVEVEKHFKERVVGEA